MGRRETAVGGLAQTTLIGGKATFLAGIAQTTVLALTALGCGLLLVGCAAAVSITWQVHPLLALAAVAGLLWVGARLARHLLH